MYGATQLVCYNSILHIGPSGPLKVSTVKIACYLSTAQISMLKFTTDCCLWMKRAVAAKPLCVLNSVRVHCIAYEFNFSIKEPVIHYFKSYTSCFHVLPKRRIQGQQIMSAVSSELYTSLVATVSRCMHASHMHQKQISCGPRLQTRQKKIKNRCQAALWITLTGKYQNCVTQDVTKTRRIRSLFSCSVSLPLSFHLSILALCLFPLLAVSVCPFLPVPVTFLSFSQCLSLSLPRLVSFTILFEPISFPSLLSLPPPSLSSLNAVILSLQNLALLSTIPNGLTYITYFTVTL